MIILDSSISFSSDRKFASKETAKESLNIWIDGKRPISSSSVAGNQSATKVTLSPEVQAGLNAINSAQLKRIDNTASSDEAVDSTWLIKKLLIEMMTGKKFKTMHIKDLQENAQTVNAQQSPAATDAAPQKDGWGIIYEKSDTHKEVEMTTMQAEGVIKTADNKEVAFRLELSMQRSSTTENSLTFRAGDGRRVDPLVINFGGNATDLTSRKFQFDLSSDGSRQDISFVGPGSGFLTIDANNDGVVNNGRELFGPSTGNGFNELSKYDSDKNNWIDENDPIFNKLKIWTKDADGIDRFSTLKEKGVGAIYLKNAATQFDSRDRQNNLNGVVKSSGIYATEDGSVGTIQQIDLVV